ncbi:GATA transcription factor 15 [Platanthera guangdongensis]|uniref:GATA transcription factor 15 n=1 Tax=Platanthera guangdongensis TaxID=2320717 RepID=A0ABR2MPH5_9ASPA
MSEAQLSGSRMDVCDEKASGSIDPSADPSNADSDVSASSGLKSCADCQTTKTPLWRGGPSGPKCHIFYCPQSLCNACGIRYRKKRRPVMGSKERDMAGERSKAASARDKREEKRDSMNGRMKSLEMTMMGFSGEIFWKLSGIIRKKNRRTLREEEEAAILLMAISSGFVYA